MTVALLHAVIRIADARNTDADLLAQFVQSRDEPAFEELVRRHGPLVWSVCRQLLPHHADAEDAFQAVFLALIQGAGNIRTGQALPAWLHGVAVRVAEKLKRTAGRRRQREARAATLEADQPIPDAAWASLMTAVHEEVQQLPDSERAAFVLCELEGIRQSDAAAQLGWPLGTLSGRLCKARQRLIDQLTRRGIVPGVLAIGGLAGSVGVVPAALVAKVSSFPSAIASGVSSTVAGLAHGLVGGATMRAKVLAAALLVAGAVGLTGGSMILSQADAQNDAKSSSGFGGGSSSSGGQGGGGGTAKASGSYGSAQPAGGGGQGNPGFGLPGMAGGGGMMPPGAGQGGVMIAGGGNSTWEYKFIDLKSEDRDLFEKEIKQAGTQGWEFCGSERLRKANDGAQLVLVFKKRHGGEFQFGHSSGGFGVIGGRSGPIEVDVSGGVGGPPGINNNFGRNGSVLVGGGPPGMGAGVGRPGGGLPGDDAQPRPSSGGSSQKGQGSSAGPGASPGGSDPRLGGPGGPGIGGSKGGTNEDSPDRPKTPMGPPGAGSAGSGRNRLGGAGMGPGGIGPGTMGGLGGMPGGPGSVSRISVVSLRFAKAEEIALVLKKVFPEVEITPDPRTNQLILRATDESAMEVTKLLQQLDVNTPLNK